MRNSHSTRELHTAHQGRVQIFLVNSAEWKADKGTSVGKPGKRTNVGVGKGGVSVSTGHKGKPVYHKAQLGIIPAIPIIPIVPTIPTIPIIPIVPIVPTIPIVLTTYAATEDQLHDNPNVTLFFMEKDLKKGTKMTLHFTKSTTPTTFLPRQVAEKIPFSSEKMPEIMNYFSVKPNSKEADIMKKTVKECEEPGIRGEEKYCATSLESMVDFITNKLGKNIQGVSTEVDRETQLQKYSITGVEKMAGDKAVVCHKQDYAHAVFLLPQDTNHKGICGFFGGRRWQESKGSGSVSHGYIGLESEALGLPSAQG
ncbi:BURP domain-containing protein [Actinidia rufa]|uniref:BURP domain-containing protein n=1 Tax=Actinidia rufa TaxID=165716 RepID=A0A7J0DHG9_9ERIC|nr:BURP domain-containing protein [Actinidia rufa]